MGRFDSGYEGIYLELQQDANAFYKRQTEALEAMTEAIQELARTAAVATANLARLIDSIPQGESE